MSEVRSSSISTTSAPLSPRLGTIPIPNKLSFHEWWRLGLRGVWYPATGEWELDP